VETINYAHKKGQIVRIDNGPIGIVTDVFYPYGSHCRSGKSAHIEILWGNGNLTQPQPTIHFTLIG